jgi:fumarate hydratase class II
VGTGLDCAPGFPALVIARISQVTGLEYPEAADHFEAQGARDAAVQTSGALKTLALSLYKIANDIRLLGSGPRCGRGLVIVTALAPVIGHDAAAQLAEESLSTGRSVRELCLERKLVTRKELKRLLDPHGQTQPRP